MDEQWIHQAFCIKQLQHTYRIKQSNFNVLCILTYSISPQPLDTPYQLPIQRYGPSIQSGVEYIVGCNVESCFIGNGLCAERSALVQLAQLRYDRIHAIYLVSDSINSILTPGLLCREFLAEYVDCHTPIIMAAYDQTNKIDSSVNKSATNPNLLQDKLMTRVTNIDELYPYKSLYLGINRIDILTYLHKFAQQNQQITNTTIPSIESIKQQFTSILNQPQRDNIHPVRLACGIFNMKSDVIDTPLPHNVYTQYKLLEYGYTLDPVCSMLNDMKYTLAAGHTQYQLNHYILIIFDQYYNCHSPVAAARAHLYENGFGELNVLLHDHITKQLHIKPLNELVPDYVNLDDILK